MSTPKLSPLSRCSFAQKQTTFFFKGIWLLLILLLLFRYLLYRPIQLPMGQTVKVVGRATRVTSQNISNQSFRLGKVEIFTKSFPLVSCGQQLVATGKLDRQMTRSGTVIFSLSDPIISIIDSKIGGGLLVVLSCWFEKAGELIEVQTSQVMVGQPLALINGLVWGQSAEMGSDFLQSMRKTDTIHLLAASGFNVSLIFGLIDKLGTYLLSWRSRTLVAFFLIWGYVGISGGEPSLVRAALMISLVLAARLTGRRRTDLRALFLAGWLMVMISPPILASLSLQLSFLATAGILFGHVLVQDRKKPPFWQEAWRVGWWAQLGVLPVLWHWFHSFAWLGLIVNPLVGVLVAPLTIGGTFLPFVGFLLPKLGQFFVWPLWLLANIFIFLINLFGSLPVEPLRLNFLPGWVAIGYYGGWLVYIWRKGVWNGQKK